MQKTNKQTNNPGLSYGYNSFEGKYQFWSILIIPHLLSLATSDI